MNIIKISILSILIFNFNSLNTENQTEVAKNISDTVSTNVYAHGNNTESLTNSTSSLLNVETNLTNINTSIVDIKAKIENIINNLNSQNSGDEAAINALYNSYNIAAQQYNSKISQHCLSLPDIKPLTPFDPNSPQATCEKISEVCKLHAMTTIFMKVEFFNSTVPATNTSSMTQPELETYLNSILDNKAGCLVDQIENIIPEYVYYNNTNINLGNNTENKTSEEYVQDMLKKMSAECCLKATEQIIKDFTLLIKNSNKTIEEIATMFKDVFSTTSNDYQHNLEEAIAKLKTYLISSSQNTSGTSNGGTDPGVNGETPFPF